MNSKTKTNTKSRFVRELNALITIAAREITLTIKQPGRLVIGLVMPLIFMGMLGGTIAQNMAGGLGFEYNSYMLVGMMINVIFMMTTEGVTSLVQDRSSDFTQELMVSPISRYSIILGKIIGASVASLFQLIGTIVMGLVLGIRFEAGQLLAVLAISPLFCLAAGAIAAMIVAFIKSERSSNLVVMLVVMPQMFLSGMIIPITHSSGILLFISRILPMTYCLDLARAVFYAGKPEYGAIVMFHPMFSFTLIAGMTVLFLMVGTYFFARLEKNK